jgi:hypothetical protein
MVIQDKVESMELIEDESVDLIISNELFPDLNRSSAREKKGYGTCWLKWPARIMAS